MSQGASNNGSTPSGGWFGSGFLNKLFGNKSEQRKRPFDDTATTSPASSPSRESIRATPSSMPVRTSPLTVPAAKRVRRVEDDDFESFHNRTLSAFSRQNDSISLLRDSYTPRLNVSHLDLPPRRGVLDAASSESFKPKYQSRTKQILDVLDSLNSSSHANSSLGTTAVLDELQATQKWLHDISASKSQPPPRRSSVRSASRISAIISEVRDNPYWLKDRNDQSKKGSTTEETTTPAVTEDATGIRPTPYSVPLAKPVTSKSLKECTGKNARNVDKPNVFSAKIDEFTVTDDEVQAASEPPLKDVPPPPGFGSGIAPGFLTKPRAFSFALPVARQPCAAVDEEEEDETAPTEEDESKETSQDEESASSSESESEEESTASEHKENAVKKSDGVDKKSPAINSETSSDNSPEDSIDKLKEPVAPLAPISAPAGAGGDAKWDCQECFVSNKGSDLQCVCCAAAKPGTGGASAPSEPPKKQVLKATVFAPPAATGSFSFGLPPAGGAPAPAAAPAAAAPAPSLFGAGLSFGLKPAETPKPTDSAPKAAAEKSEAKPPLFGSLLQPTTSFSTNSTASSATVKSDKPEEKSSLFGSATPFAPKSDAPLAPSIFGAPSTTSAAPPTTFTFGATAKSADAPKPSLFGSAAPKASSLFGNATTASSTDSAAPKPPFTFGASSQSKTNLLAVPTTSVAVESNPIATTTTANNGFSPFGIGKPALSTPSQPPLFGAAAPAANGFSLNGAPQQNSSFGTTRNTLNANGTTQGDGQSIFGQNSFGFGTQNQQQQPANGFQFTPSEPPKAFSFTGSSSNNPFSFGNNAPASEPAPAGNVFQFHSNSAAPAANSMNSTGVTPFGGNALGLGGPAAAASTNVFAMPSSSNAPRKMLSARRKGRH